MVDLSTEIKEQPSFPMKQKVLKIILEKKIIKIISYIICWGKRKFLKLYIYEFCQDLVAQCKCKNNLITFSNSTANNSCSPLLFIYYLRSVGYWSWDCSLTNYVNCIFNRVIWDWNYRMNICYSVNGDDDFDGDLAADNSFINSFIKSIRKSM